MTGRDGGAGPSATATFVPMAASSPPGRLRAAVRWSAVTASRCRAWQAATDGGELPGAPLSGSPGGWLIARSVMVIAAFSAGLLAARERVVWTDPGSLRSLRVARTPAEGNLPRP